MNAPRTTTAHGHSIDAGDGERIWIVGDTMTLKATGDSTGGSLVLLENLTAPGGGPPAPGLDRQASWPAIPAQHDLQVRRAAQLGDGLRQRKQQLA